MSPQIVAVAILCATAGAQAAPVQDELPRDWLTRGQAEPLLKRMLEREPFLRSDEARTERASLNLFFGREDYRALHGSPVLGYWASAGFRWTGTRVAWNGIASVAPSAKPITRKAWDAAFAYVARKHGLILDQQAPIRIGGACVAAVLTPTVAEPKRGVALEVRVQSPTGSFRFRFGTGKATIEDAIGASLDRLVSFAMALPARED